MKILLFYDFSPSGHLGKPDLNFLLVLALELPVGLLDITTEVGILAWPGAPNTVMNFTVVLKTITNYYL